MSTWSGPAVVARVRIERTLAVELDDAPAPPPATLRELVLALEAQAQPAPCPTEVATTVWRGLLSGAWSLLDSFDHDDRWYLVARARASAEPRPVVSAREQQVLDLAARGHANKYIGYELGLSPSTVATHLRRGLTKLGVPSRAALVSAAPVAALAAGPAVDEMTMDR